MGWLPCGRVQALVRVRAPGRARLTKVAKKGAGAREGRERCGRAAKTTTTGGEGGAPKEEKTMSRAKRRRCSSSREETRLLVVALQRTSCYAIVTVGAVVDPLLSKATFPSSP